MEALNYAKDNNLEFFVMGGGSNILVSDEGFKGLVIHLQDTRYKIQDTFIECGAGLKLSEAIKIATDNLLTGLEWAAGIPGTVGGAVRGNAGAFGSCMADTTDNVGVINIAEEVQSAKLKVQNFSSKLKVYNNNECKFDYRSSIFKHKPGLIITSVVLKLRKGDKAEIEAKIKENIQKRTKKQPQGQSAGSFFKNPGIKDDELIEKYEKDTGNKVVDGKIPAGWLIAEAGFLGKKIGQIQVSEKHGNFVINLGGGKAQDAIILASIIKQKIREKFNIQLKEEVQFVGF